MNARALTGIMTGTTIMFLFGAVWLFFGTFGGRPQPAAVRTSILLVGLVFALWIVILGTRTLRLSRAAPPLAPQEAALEERIGRRFGWISGLEGGAIAVAVIILNVIHHPDEILPVIALIVGLHFFPLASLFGAQFYYLTGAVGCAIGLAGFFMPDVALRISFVGLSFGILLWVTSLIRLVQARRLIWA